MMSREDWSHLVYCNCNYRCSREARGFDYVSERTRRLHMQKDRDGVIIHPRDVRRCTSHPFQQDLDSGATHNIPHCDKAQHGQRCSTECDICFRYNGMSRVQEWRDKMALSFHRAMTGLDIEFDAIESESIPDDSIEDDNRMQPPMQYGMFILPKTPLSLDMGIYRQTWALQSMLDEAKVPQGVQNKILQMLFGKVSPLAGGASSSQPDMSGLGLGALLRHAGVDWDGGPLGIQALSSFDGLCDSFEAFGMPTLQRWRLCIGSEKKWHTPEVFPPSDQDDYNVTTGVKCECAGHNGSSNQKANKWKLKRDCERCSERCCWEECTLMRKDMIRFEYLPVGPLLKKLCSSRSICHEFLEMWREKERWFRRGSIPSTNFKQWWDGSKASEFAWFWDKDQEFQLPVLCRKCYACYGTIPELCTELLDPDNWNDATNQYEFPCSDCGCKVISPRKLAKGDPRNIALMAHWDGFQSAKTAHRSTWTVEVSVLNAGTGSSLPPIPVLFIPPCDDHNIGKKKFKILDALLEPFIRDLLLALVDGIQLKYNYPVELIDNILMDTDDFILRAMPMLFTGDHPAQCKFGGWNDKGHSACRRCKMSSRWTAQSNSVRDEARNTDSHLKGRVVYDKNRRQMRYPPPYRNIEHVKDGVKKLSKASTKKERDKTSKEYGVSSISRAWRLYDLAGFCLIRDLVYDTMHILALCLFKKFCHLLVASIDKQDQEKFEEALSEVTRRRPKGFDGRWPKQPFARLGYFKAEEYTRFIIWCVPHILDEMGLGLDTPIGAQGLLLVEIARLFYIRTRAEGWTSDAIDLAKSLLASWRVRSEDTWGPNGAILEHVAGNGELFDDIVRHGPHYVFWAYGFERMVSDYARTRTNQKDMEITFSRHFARRFFTRVSTIIWQDDDGLFPHQRALSQVHNCLRVPKDHRKEHNSRTMRDFECLHWHGHCVCIVSSQHMALELWDGLLRSVQPYICKGMVLTKGIGIGSSRKQFGKELSTSSTKYIEKYWKEFGLLTNHNKDSMSNTYTPLRSVVWRKIVYRPGDHVVVLVDRTEETRNPLNWKAVVRQLFMHEFMGHMEMFFQADWYKQKLVDGEAEIDIVSKFTLHQKDFDHDFGDNCRPISRILHKYIPIHRKRRGGEGSTEIVALEMEDTWHRELDLRVTSCPPFPEVHDIMSAIGKHGREDKQLSLCVIRAVLHVTEEEPRHTAPEQSGQGISQTTIEPTCEEEEEEEEEDATDEIEDDAMPMELNEDIAELVHIPTQELGRVEVSWLKELGRDTNNHRWTAGETIESELKFLQLVRLETTYEEDKRRGQWPIRWKKRNELDNPSTRF